MCIKTPLQQKIIDRTNDGDQIAAFLVDTMNGQTPGVKVCHRMDAAKQLTKYGFPNERAAIIDRHSRAGGNPVEEEQGGDETPAQSPLSPGERARVRGKEIAAPVTHLDILNYQIAHLIRHETAEGHTLVEFLIHTMTGRDRPFTPKKFRIKPADRIAAARELLRRGFGDLGSRRKQSDNNDEANAYDTLHTDLAKRMREYSERGADTVRFLLEVMSDPDPDLEFTIHHRMSAAQELLRRGWDTNHDNIKPEHLQDYWRDDQSPRLTIGQKKTLAGFTTSIDDYDNYDDTDYEAIAKEMKEEEDREAAASKSLHPRYGKIRACPELAEGTGVTEPVSKTLPRNESGGTATSSSRHSRESRNPENQEAATSSKPPLPQGEGWGAGSAGILNNPPPHRRGRSLPPAKARARMGVMEPVSKTLPMSESGDETIRKSNNTDDKNIYDYGHNDPDPEIDYYFEPLNPEEQALFDYEARLESGDFPKGEAPKEPPPPPPSAYAEYSDALRRIKDAAAREGVPVLPNPLAGKLHAVKIRSP